MVTDEALCQRVIPLEGSGCSLDKPVAEIVPNTQPAPAHPSGELRLGRLLSPSRMRRDRHAETVTRHFGGSLDDNSVTRPLAASFSSAPVKQEQRIRFDCLRRVASPQLALRRLDRRPDPLHRVVG
jgi:hypothetical protein